MAETTEDVRQLLSLMQQYGVTFEELGVDGDEAERLKALMEGGDEDDEEEFARDVDSPQQNEDAHMHQDRQLYEYNDTYESVDVHTEEGYAGLPVRENYARYDKLGNHQRLPSVDENDHEEGGDDTSSSSQSDTHKGKHHKHNGKHTKRHSRKEKKRSKQSKRPRRSRRASSSSGDSSSTSAESQGLNDVLTGILHAVTAGNTATHKTRDEVLPTPAVPLSASHQEAETEESIPTVEGSTQAQRLRSLDESELYGSSVPMFVPFSPSPVKTKQQVPEQATQNASGTDRTSLGSIAPPMARHSLNPRASIASVPQSAAPLDDTHSTGEFTVLAHEGLRHADKHRDDHVAPSVASSINNSFSASDQPYGQPLFRAGHTVFPPSYIDQQGIPPAQPGDGHVVVLLSSLRQQASHLADLERELQMAIRDRDTAESRADAQMTKAVTLENELARDRVTFRSELDRMAQLHSSELLRLREAHSAEMSRLQLAHEAELSRLQTALRMKDMEADHLRSRDPSMPPTHGLQHTPTDEEFVILSDEVDRLQNHVSELTMQLQHAHSELAVLRSRPSPIESSGIGSGPPADAPDRSPQAARPMTTAAKLAAMKKGFDPFAPSADNEFVQYHSSAPVPTSIESRARSDRATEPVSEDVTKLRRQVMMLQADVDTLQSALESEKRRAVELEKQLTQREDELARVRHQLDTANAKLSAAEKDARNAIANMQTAEADAERRRQRIAQLETQVADFSRQMENKEREVLDLRRQIPGLQQQAADKAGELDSARYEIMQLRDKLKEVQQLGEHSRRPTGSPPSFRAEPAVFAPPRAAEMPSHPVRQLNFDAPRHEPPPRQYGSTAPPPSLRFAEAPSNPPSPPRMREPAPQMFHEPAVPSRIPAVMHEQPQQQAFGSNTGSNAASVLEAELAAARARFQQSERERTSMAAHSRGVVDVEPVVSRQTAGQPQYDRLTSEHHRPAPAVDNAPRVNPYEVRRSAPQPSLAVPGRSMPAAAPDDPERNRRLAILADIAASQRRSGAPYGPPAGVAMDMPRHPAQPVAPRAMVVTSEMEEALPLSTAAQARQDEEARQRDMYRPTKREADAEALVREIHAPFATQGSMAVAEASTTDVEAQLVQLNQSKTFIEAELERIGPGAPRTLKDRNRKAELSDQLGQVEKKLSELRIWLKVNNKR